MAGGPSLDEEDGITGINVIPLVDIMLVLLVIFMVTMQFIQQRPKPPPVLDLQLPAARTSDEPPPDNDPTVLSLVLNKEGAIFLNNDETTLPKVLNHIKGLQTSSPSVKLQAIISADKRLSHGQVIQVLDLMKSAGILDIAVNTKAQEIE